MKLTEQVRLAPRALQALTVLAYVGGTALLLLGAWYYDQYDWDYGVSLVMAGTAYLVVPRMRFNLLGAFYWWVAVDGSYWGYNALRGVDVNDLRPINFVASSSLLAFLVILEVLRRTSRASRT